MIKNNFNSTCPTYEELKQLDSSIEEYSGYWTKTDNYFHRDKTPYKNSWRYYDFDPTIRIIVDPPSGMSERIKLIILKPNFDIYKLKSSMEQESKFEYVDVVINETISKKAKAISIINQTQKYARILYHDRYVDNCKVATINADIWKVILPDTIHYLRTDCKITQIIDKEIIYPNYTDIDITTTSDYQYKEWISQIKQFCIFKYRECTD